MGHQQATNKEPYNGDKRWHLQVAKSANGMPGGTTTGIARSKPDQEATEHQEEDAF